MAGTTLSHGTDGEPPGLLKHEQLASGDLPRQRLRMAGWKERIYSAADPDGRTARLNLED